MVKHIKKIALLFAGAMLLFTACSNIAGSSGSVSGGATRAYDGTVDIYCGGDGTYGRFLAPATLTNDDIAYFKITGESLTGYPFAAQEFKATGTTYTKDQLLAGEAKLEGVALDDWNFTLWAYDSSDNLLLKGTSRCNMKSGIMAVTFNLNSYQVTTLGSYDITIKYNGDGWVPNSYSFTWSLYDVVTGECLSTSGEKGGTAQTVTAGTSTSITADPKVFDGADKIDVKDGSTGYLAQGTSVTPGTYVFGVWLKNGSEDLAYASDIILIEPGRKTTADLEIGSIISTEPDAPEDFKAQRIYPSTDAEKISDEIGFYDVRFIWTDKSNNETEYELILQEFNDTNTPWAAYDKNATISTAAGSGTTIYTFGNVYTLTNDSDPIRYVAGSLYADSTEVVLRFPTGHMYDAQLRAKNKIGTSASVIRATDATGATTPQALGAADDGASAAAKTTISTLESKTVTGFKASTSAPFNHINLTRIIYNLNGGTLTTAAGSSYAGTNYVEYKVYELDSTKDLTSANYNDETDADYVASCLPLMETKSSPAYPQLKKDGKDSTGWRTYINGILQEVKFNVNKYKDIIVQAGFGATSGDITITAVSIEKLPALADSRVSAYYGTDNTGATNTDVAKNGTIKIKRGDPPKYVTVKVGAAAADTTVFVKFHLFVKGSTMCTIAANEASTVVFPTFSTDELNDGTSTEVMVVGETASGRLASQKFLITKTN